ncbi:MAG: hypothetical protein ACREOU_02320 [Candidatus Eiseniibacteriota bacterium]
MRYPFYLEVGPHEHTLAYVFLLPGVVSGGRTPEAAWAALPPALAAEFDRLAEHGAPWTHAAEPIELVEAERVTVTSDIERGVSTALFRYELRPTTDQDVALALERLRFSRVDFERVIARARAAGGDAWGSGSRAATIVGEAADTEWWLLSRLGTRPDAKLPPDPVERLPAVHALTVERLTNLLPGDRERHAVFAGEPWTTRKVLRRLLQNERTRTVELAALVDPTASTSR